VIERVTGQRIAVERVPSVEDLRTRRLDQTAAALRAALEQGGLDVVASVVDALAQEHDLREVALAAVKLLHEGTGAADEQEIPEPSTVRSVPPARPDARGRTGERSSGPGAAARGGAPSRSGLPAGRGRTASGVHRTTGEPMTRLFVGAGHNAGMRPQDLVGAIAGETRLSGKDVGAIEILERFSLVEVPEAAADEVVAALRGTRIKGGTPTVRRERG
jgi:ATP-dependent RNA helicase DeaD